MWNSLKSIDNVEGNNFTFAEVLKSNNRKVGTYYIGL